MCRGPGGGASFRGVSRSEEGRGGEEGRFWGAPDYLKKKKKTIPLAHHPIASRALPTLPSASASGPPTLPARYPLASPATDTPLFGQTREYSVNRRHYTQDVYDRS